MTTATDLHPLRLAGLGVVIAAALGATSQPARAQSVEAETLFREGKRLMKKGDIAQACDKFEAAERVEATASTELNLAACREDNGQHATAWAMFLKAAATARHAGDARREAEARRRAALLEPRLIYLTIAVPASSRIEGLVIQRNDAAIDPALWDQAVPVDPDEYTVSGTAPGHARWSTAVVVKTRSKKVEVPVLDPLPEPRRAPVHDEAATRADADAGAADADGRGELRATASPAGLTGQRKLAIAIAAFGAAAAGTGVGLGLHARNLEHDVDAVCPQAACPDADAVQRNATARRYALAANIGFGVGGAAIASAVILWLTGAPPASKSLAVTPLVGTDRVGLTLGRAF